MKARLDRATARRNGKSAARRTPAGPPQLLPENILPWAVFRSCLTQLILGPAGGVVGISHDSLDLKFRVYGVSADREAEVYEKFEFLEGIFVAEVNKNLKADESTRNESRVKQR